MKYKSITIAVCLLMVGLIPTACFPQQVPVPTVTQTPENFAEKIDIGGRGLYLICLGSGSPTVILEAGLDDTSDIWNSVQLKVQNFTRVCAYDRAGLGKSDPGKKPHTSRDAVLDVHTLLHNANVSEPYLLVGHSIGGFIMRLFAAQYPEEVSGMILVDSTHPDENTRSLAALPPEAPAEDSGVRDIRRIYTLFWNDPTQNEEGMDIAASADQVRGVSSLGDTPIIVLTAGLTQWSLWPPSLPQDVQVNLDRVQQELQKELIELSSNSEQIIAAESHHWIQSDQPDLVVEVIQQMVDMAH
jgi:pimeloyl-ACP methyl ester carboxylesterase